MTTGGREACKRDPGRSAPDGLGKASGRRSVVADRAGEPACSQPLISGSSAMKIEVGTVSFEDVKPGPEPFLGALPQPFSTVVSDQVPDARNGEHRGCATHPHPPLDVFADPQ